MAWHSGWLQTTKGATVSYVFPAWLLLPYQWGLSCCHDSFDFSLSNIMWTICKYLWQAFISVWHLYCASVAHKWLLPSNFAPSTAKYHYCFEFNLWTRWWFLIWTILLSFGRGSEACKQFKNLPVAECKLNNQMWIAM